jgi:DNA repair protein RecN (Recombination protein N)
MLTRLRIQNYALIRELDVDMSPGFTIITGETGAGKSILLGALSLILGQRADLTVLKDNEKKCIVEAVFNVAGYGLEEIFALNDLDYEEQTIFRREIAPNGKSRAFINDTPVTLKALQDIGFRLIDIHSQHQNLELNSQQFQLMVVDNYAGNLYLLSQYKLAFSGYRRLISELKEAEEKAGKLRADLDYFQFPFDQLKSADLVANEQEELEQELKMLNHAEEIKNGLALVSDLINSEEESVLVRMKESLNQISRLSIYFPQGEELRQRLETVYVELKDISFEVDTLSEKIEYDPSRITFVSERLDLIYSLQQKHRVGSVDELISLRDHFADSIKAVSSNDEEILALRELLQQKKEEATVFALKLTKARKSVVSQIESRIKEQLMQLGMPNSQFKVEISTAESLTHNGSDQVNFLFTANKNGALNEISKVASGGELSRLMLAIKALISKSKALPTIIFDEIDSGISGEIADKMGTILKGISADMQVINITHLPQIAAKGDHHYLVYKFDTAEETITHLRLLSKNERVDELAKMLSGENITHAAILNAEELLK